MCGGPGMDMKISSTIGFERDHNPTLAITDEEEFVEQAVAKLGPQPPNFKAIVELNKGPLRHRRPRGPAAGPAPGRAEALARVRCSSTREPTSSSTTPTSPAPSASRCSRAGFGSKLAWLADRDQEIVLIGRDDEDGRRAARLASPSASPTSPAFSAAA